MASPHLRSSSEATEASDTTDSMERGQLGSVVLSDQTDKSWEIVGYIVAEVQLRSAAPYTRGSGPPMLPISIMPRHDKPGIILDLIQMDGSPVYIVGYEDKPALRMGVRAANILDHVSARTLENWEIEQETIRDQRRKGKGKVNASIQPSKEESRGDAGIVRGPGRPPKRKRSVEEDERDVSMSVEVPDVGPGRARKKQARKETLTKQSSLSSPSKQHGPSDIFSESEFEDEDTAFALAQQLKGSDAVRLTTNIDTQEASSGSTSPEPVKASKKAITNVRNTRSSSRQTRSTSATSVQVVNDPKRQRSQPRRGSVAMSSSLEAANIYENLEKKKGKPSMIKPITFYPSSATASIQKGSTKPVPGKQSKAKQTAVKPAAQVVDLDEVYDVDEILGEKFQKNKKGKMVKYYLIKWVGNWPNSWEPHENVGSEAVEIYEKKKRLEVSEAQRSNTASQAGENGDNEGAAQNKGFNAHGNGMRFVGVDATAAQTMGEVTKDTPTSEKENGSEGGAAITFDIEDSPVIDGNEL
ncbi:hypothetical protein EG329_009611 [Mollisiaceae sp. DMI_Dod_QoI]|nr:hypothetical protein EG329_009611 [Helotiales sp. DMI_Dod_QoI]